MRNLSEIALEVRKDWSNVNFAAKPYLEAMGTLNSVKENYLFDSGYEIVGKFLCNAGAWRGEVAKRIKKELNKMLKS